MCLSRRKPNKRKDRPKKPNLQNRKSRPQPSLLKQNQLNRKTKNNRKRQAMNLKYTIALLTLLTVFYFVPATAQTKKTTTKKQPVKTTQKPAVKAKAPAKGTAAQKASAKNLGDAASKVPAADTTKKGGQN